MTTKIQITVEIPDQEPSVLLCALTKSITDHLHAVNIPYIGINAQIVPPIDATKKLLVEQIITLTVDSASRDNPPLTIQQEALRAMLQSRNMAQLQILLDEAQHEMMS